MDDRLTHPDDATLFDLLEGALEPAREQDVIAHLERCSACAAFVDAARAGAPETTTAVVAMGEAASERLHLRLAEGWRERMATLAAAEAREDATAAPSAVPMPSGAAQLSTNTTPSLGPAISLGIPGISTVLSLRSMSPHSR
jgi:anti-sigma factor RsiW